MAAGVVGGRAGAGFTFTPSSDGIVRVPARVAKGLHGGGSLSKGEVAASTEILPGTNMLKARSARKRTAILVSGQSAVGADIAYELRGEVRSWTG